MVENHLELQAEILTLIDKKVTTQKNLNMGRLPSEAEIKKMVFGLPKDKAPGIDGVTEALIKGWEFMKPTCVVMVHAYWRDGILSTKVAAGVIKLIPKNNEITNLSN